MYNYFKSIGRHIGMIAGVLMVALASVLMLIVVLGLGSALATLAASVVVIGAIGMALMLLVSLVLSILGLNQPSKATQEKFEKLKSEIVSEIEKLKK
ncbi:hypothetical protein KNT64_gp081 [Pseudomonas phage PspYZU05]|uniref:Holin n=1 Tax=Pseudomonas phage PspYZU05 TaxID=1983556 RepID=A0A2U7N8A3_9CAUD|nr:hypothetical protein KNT64_gp081 [Pseudomonas phage PspYZU05]ASD52033.1 hypothetical protein PspYZU05_81 [Pseudomonas phage PspYZU05]